MTTGLVSALDKFDRCVGFFSHGSDVPADITQEEWTDWIRYACSLHRQTAWRVADMIEFGMDKFGESYFALIEMTGYETGYVQKIEGWVRRGLIATRKYVLATNPECESLPHSWWEAVAPVRDDAGKGWQDAGADRQQIMETRKAVILKGAGMETDAFKALCSEFRTVRSIPGEVPKKRAAKADSATVVEVADVVDAKFAPPTSDETYWHLTSEHSKKVDAFRAYFSLPDADSIVIIERIIDQLYTIKKERLKKYEL